MKKSVCFIIPCYDSEQTIIFCIESIINQEVDNNIEILIIDSSKNDQIKNKLIKFNYNNLNIVISESKLFAGQARNLGLMQSSADYYALIDSDIILPSDWTKVMLGNYKKNSVGSLNLILAGSIKNAKKTKSYSKDSLLMLMCNQFLESKNIIERKYLGGSNLFFDDKTKNKVKFPNMKLGEDVLMTKNAVDKGVKLLTIGSNVVEHITLKSLVKYSFELGIASYIISKNSNENISLPIKIIFGSFYKLCGVIISIIKYSPKKLIELLFLSPGVILGALFYHIGIVHAVIRGKSHI